ncbi:MAG TPA: M13 family metallopeptidase [Reyranella sp.]|jgi:predicted metalloendopeptidase
MLRKLVLLAVLLTCAVSSVAQQRSGLDLSSIDPGVRPQDDLWRFANGKWLARTEIPADRAGWDTFTALRDATQGQLRDLLEAVDVPADGERRKLSDFYASFMDEKTVEAAGLAALKPELARIKALDDKAGLPALFAHLNPLQVHTPWILYVEPDERAPTTYAAHLTQGRLTLPDRDYYLRDDPHFQKVRAALRGHIVRLLTLAGENVKEADADGVIALETALARLQWTRVQNRDPLKTYNKRLVADLPALTADGGWRPYFGAAGVAVDGLVVEQPSYFEGLHKVIDDVPLATWRTYLTFSLVSVFAEYLPKALVDEDFDFDQHVLRGVPENQPRWKRGVGIVDRLMGFALGHLYVDRYFPPANKVHAEALIGNLMAVYAESLATLDRMGDDTRREALAKLKAIQPKIGYPEKWRSYEGLAIRRGDLVGNVMRGRRFNHAFWIAKLGQPVGRAEWGTPPQIVNAFYNATRNEIIFPAGILQPPFFDAGADDAANYGGIGTVIGHEISHAFDDEGSRYDGAGVLRNWWTAADRERFEALTKRMVQQYDAYSPIEGYHVNGALTLGENVADNAGLAMAVRAWRHALAGKKAPTLDGYSGEQRLFIAFAQIWKMKVREAAQIERLKTDPHSPGQFRADGAAVNQSPFADAFALKPGDAMYRAPDDRISLW